MHYSFYYAFVWTFLAHNCTWLPSLVYVFLSRETVPLTVVCRMWRGLPDTAQWGAVNLPLPAPQPSSGQLLRLLHPNFISKQADLGTVDLFTIVINKYVAGSNYFKKRFFESVYLDSWCCMGIHLFWRLPIPVYTPIPIPPIFPLFPPKVLPTSVVPT